MSVPGKSISIFGHGRDHDRDTENIVLKADCPFGCPCDAFDCEPDKKSVLVLNTNKSSSVPVLIKFDG